MHISLPKFTSKGFTLLELLIVITIIGLLAAFVAASFSTLQRNARDQKRKSDLSNIAAILERYYGDNSNYPKDSSGASPPTGGLITSGYNTWCKIPFAGFVKSVAWGAGATGSQSNDLKCSASTSPVVVKIYAKSLPADPLVNPPYCYKAADNSIMNGYASSFTLYARLENANDPDLITDVSGNPTTEPCNGVNYNYKVTPNQ